MFGTVVDDGRNAVDQAPPLIPELMSKDIWANPIACAILKAILGPELVCHYASGRYYFHYR